MSQDVLTVIPLTIEALSALVNAGLLNHSAAAPAQAVAQVTYYSKEEADAALAALALLPNQYVLVEPSRSA